jgi:hypothetical protein
MKPGLYAATTCRWLCLAALSLLGATAQAGRPLVTEDAAVLGKAECEWESYAGRSQEADTRLTVLNTQVGCGLGARSQVAASYGQAKTEGVKITLTGLNGKTNLFKTAQDATAITLAWGVASAKAEGAKATAVFLNGVLTHTYNNKFTAHLNLGWNQQRAAGEKEQFTNWSVAGEYNLGNGMELMAEAVGVEHEKPSMGAGLRFAASKAWSLNASVHTSTSSPRTNTATVGAKLTF